MTTADVDIYYDPYDKVIDEDPYPLWRRMRDEQPLYYNEKYDFYAVSRFVDVDKVSTEWKSYISSRGTTFEGLKANMQMPPALLIFDDPPAHDIYRSVLSRVFRPKAVAD